jgi:hypothetical protein
MTLGYGSLVNVFFFGPWQFGEFVFWTMDGKSFSRLSSTGNEKNHRQEENTEGKASNYRASQLSLCRHQMTWHFFNRRYFRRL